jgi:hypothetical protein
LEIFSNPGQNAGKFLAVIGDIIPKEMVDTFIRVENAIFSRIKRKQNT